MELVIDNDIEIAILTETWINDSNNFTTSTIKSYGYSIIHWHRDNQIGGGVGIIYKNLYTFKERHFTKYTSFEYVVTTCKLSQLSGNLIIVVIYRLGQISFNTFFSEFTSFLEIIMAINGKLIIAGDVNIHNDVTNAPETIKFNDILESCNLKQHCVDATHEAGHILDVVIGDKSTFAPTDLFVRDNYGMSDHFPTFFTVNYQLDTVTEKEIHFRKTKDIDNSTFSNALHAELCQIAAHDTFAEAHKSYEKCCTDVLNIHAPLQTKTVKIKAHAPWFDAEYINIRKKRRKAEHQWKKTGLYCDRQTYLEVRRTSCKIAAAKKTRYYTTEIEKCQGDQRKLYSLVNNLLDKDSVRCLPAHDSSKELADNMNDFFVSKIDKIRDNIPLTPEHSVFNQPQNYTGSTTLTHFRPTTVEEIKDILSQSGIKASPSDPLPTDILKTCTDTLIPYWCALINLSLEKGDISSLKEAEINPTLKKQGLDPEVLNNYRPISNLKFLSKLAERVVLSRLNEHLISNNLRVNNQFGYKKGHSAETLLVQVVDNILVAADQKTATVLLLLDLSAAFDTVDHMKLLKILSHEIGIQATALKWFKSFLTCRTQKVNVNGTYSNDILIKFGVPQGSVLGPVLFNIYIRSINKVVEACGFSVCGYADDHQVYKSFFPNKEYQVMVSDISNCISKINSWMNFYFLKLNPNKTEIIVLGCKSITDKLNINGTILNDGSVVRCSDYVKNLGVILDKHLQFDKHINKITSHCYHLLRKLSSIGKFLSKEQRKILVHASVTSRLDMCNALFYGISNKLISKLQRVQNSSARFVFGLHRHEQVSPLLRELHWLHIGDRIKFKILLLVFKCLTDHHAPEKMKYMMNYTALHDASLLHVPRRQSAWGDRAFSTIGPKLWNALPPTLRKCSSLPIFKKALKHYLFNSSEEFNQVLNIK